MRRWCQRLSPVAVAGHACVFGSPVMGQACAPGWDPAIGTRGIQQGRVSAFRVFDDGTGERVFIGGSFINTRGGANLPLVASWEAGTNTWASQGAGLHPGVAGGEVKALEVFDTGQRNELIVGGLFQSAATATDSASLARWDGTRWENLGTGWNLTNRGSVSALKAWDGPQGKRLYVGGSFSNIGGVSAACIAAWDGQNWFSLGAGATGSFDPTVFALEVFDDGRGEALYACGRFDAIDGVPAMGIARWDGKTWTRVGEGLLVLNPLDGLTTMAVHDDGFGPTLYVGGSAFVPAGGSVTSVAAWNGAVWRELGQMVSGRVTSLASFNDTRGSRLYLGGVDLPELGHFARWEGAEWRAVDGLGVGGEPVPPSLSLGLNPLGVHALHTTGEELLVGGTFTLAGTHVVLGMAARSHCGERCYPDCDTSTGRGVLDIFDFLCFGNRFAANDPYACNCDFTGPGACDIFDFLCFGNAFSAGCP